MDDDLDDIDVLPFVETSDVVRLSHSSLVEDEVNGSCMILHIKPVADVLSLAINGQRLSVSDIVDEQGNEFLGELIRTVIIGTVGDDGGHTIGIMVSTHEMVGTGLGCRIGTVWTICCILAEEFISIGQMMLTAARCRGEWRLYAFGTVHLQRPIHLIGTYMIESLPFVFLGQTFPVFPGSLEECERTHHIGTCKGKWVLDATVHMALSSQMNDTVHMFFSYQSAHSLIITDIHAHKAVVGSHLHVRQVTQIARISQFVETDDFIVGVFIHEEAHHMASYEACTTCDDDSPFHYIYMYYYVMPYYSVSLMLLIHFRRDSAQ